MTTHPIPLDPYDRREPYDEHAQELDGYRADMARLSAEEAAAHARLEAALPDDQPGVAMSPLFALAVGLSRASAEASLRAVGAAGAKARDGWALDRIAEIVALEPSHADMAGIRNVVRSTGRTC